jgi:excisionase family DNA binding protein
MMYLTVKELSEYLRIKEKTVYYLVRQGSIPHYRIGKLVRFKQDEIDAWMQSHKAGQIRVDKIVRSIYNPDKGGPDHLKREVM